MPRVYRELGVDYSDCILDLGSLAGSCSRLRSSHWKRGKIVLGKARATMSEWILKTLYLMGSHGQKVVQRHQG